MNVDFSAERPPSRNASPSLLVNTLQRIYLFVDRHPRQPSPGAAHDREGGSSTGSMVDLIESVFLANELDPLPFVNRHDDRKTALPSTPAWQKPALGDCESAVLVCPYRGNHRLSPERIAGLLKAAGTRGRLVDVSMSGAALHLAEAFPSNTRIAIRVYSRAPGNYVDASATVLRCRQDEEAGWHVVCRFDKNLTFEQIHLVGQDLFASTIV